MCVRWVDARFWQASDVPLWSLWDLLAPFRCECGIGDALAGMGGWVLLLLCLMAEPGHIRKAASRSLVSGLLCVSHHLEVAFICFNLTALDSSGEHCHPLVLPSTTALHSAREGGWVQSALQ